MYVCLGSRYSGTGGGGIKGGLRDATWYELFRGREDFAPFSFFLMCGQALFIYHVLETSFVGSFPTTVCG